MNIVTLAEAKERLSIDFDTKDNEIGILVNSIESYLSFATGLKLDDSYIANDSDPVYNLAKEYVLYKLYLDYYNDHNETNDLRLTSILGQLKVIAHVYPE